MVHTVTGVPGPEHCTSSVVGTAMCFHFPGGTVAYQTGDVAGRLGGCNSRQYYSRLGRGAEVQGDGSSFGDYVGM